MLRYGVSESELPDDILNAEIARIEKLGVRFRLGIRVGQAISMEEVRKQFDAVFVAVGELKEGDAESLQFAPADKIKVDGAAYATDLPGVFAGGDAVRRRRMTVRAVADGKEAAQSIAQYLSGQQVTGPEKQFNSRMGKLAESETPIFLQSASSQPRTKPFGIARTFSVDEARAESLRCLRCDCRKPDACRLRQYAQAYDCGICIRIASEAGEALGLTFVGRGFDVRVAVPFDGTLADGLRVAAERCVAACPTGALAFKDGKGPSSA
jgi:hypothetical protein